MLAIKTVLADTDDIPTLIFDEIDTGISGRTAQKVSERLSYIGRKHQVLCITHLPQIAAMADTHFEIKKSVENGVTATKIRKLTENDQVDELARLLGGAEITEKVRENAEEMKRLAGETKSRLNADAEAQSLRMDPAVADPSETDFPGDLQAVSEADPSVLQAAG